MQGKIKNKDTILLAVRIVLMASILMSCTPMMSARNENVEIKDTEITQPVYVAVLFQVIVPDDFSNHDEKLYLDVLDEVTGIGLNPKRYPMEKTADSSYAVRIPLIIGSVVKYRYSKDSPPAIEYTPDREQVRYRLFYAMSPAEVNDQISGWIDQPYQSPVGRIQGTVFDQSTNEPVSNLLITAGGVHTLTAADGSFLLEGLAAGTHNMVTYSLDGTYQPFQQGAVVAADSTTPVSISLVKQPTVNITFVARPPTDSIPGIPIRLIGNIYSLGNTFADLDGGVNTISSRTPLMSLTSDGMYFLTLSLPVGLDLRYKYTLGDGFWNAEHKSDGSFFTRQLIVPDEDIIIEDTIETWKTETGSDAISFFIKAPDNTPASDTISIQFSPFSWMEPIPMWPMGNQEWLYVLYGPLNIDSERVLYRFCRNDQCGMADDNSSHAEDGGFDYFDPSVTPQTIDYEIKEWYSWNNENISYNTAVNEPVIKAGNFIAGVEMQSGYHPNWQPYINWSIEEVNNIGANWIVMTPTWSYTRNNLPVLELLPGKDALKFDEQQIGLWISQKGKNLALFPMVNYSDTTGDEWWLNAERDAGWWQSWFDRYRTYILNFADMATQMQAGTLVLGEPSLLPALPGGVLSDGTASGVPASSSEYWSGLLAEVRTRYSGTISWALEYDGSSLVIPDFISQVDQIYLLWSAPLTTGTTSSVDEMVDEINVLMEGDIYNLKETYQKPIIIAIDYASVSSMDVETENGAMESVSSINGIDLEKQARLYDAMLISVNQHSWIDGFISRGFYQPVALQDGSSSIYGKPAENVLNYWYTSFLAGAGN